MEFLKLEQATLYGPHDVLFIKFRIYNFCVRGFFFLSLSAFRETKLCVGIFVMTNEVFCQNARTIYMGDISAV